MRGVALITAMLVTAMVSLVALEMMRRQQLDIRRTANIFGYDQAWLYSQSMEAWSTQVLIRDASQGPVDHLLEEWAQRLPPLPVEGGEVVGEVIDQQGLYNLNNLLNGALIDPIEFVHFQRLLLVLGIPVDITEQLANALADWLDPDQDRRFPGGAEDQDYLLNQPPYRAANGPLRSVSELRLVKGFTPEIYALVAPVVTALPERTPININTAPLPIILSLVPDMRPIDAEALIEGRGARGYQDVASFSGLPIIAVNAPLLTQGTGISVGSHWFLAHGRATIEHLSLEFYSLLFRNQGQVVAVQRATGVW